MEKQEIRQIINEFANNKKNVKEYDYYIVQLINAIAETSICPNLPEEKECALAAGYRFDSKNYSPASEYIGLDNECLLIQSVYIDDLPEFLRDKGFINILWLTQFVNESVFNEAIDFLTLKVKEFYNW